MAEKKKITIQKKSVEKTTKSRKTSSKKKYFYAVGRRKTAAARIRLYEGKGENLVNSQPMAIYFPGKMAEIFYTKPFRVASALGKYWATIRVSGSGKESQLAAVVHGLSRALNKAEPEKYHSLLKKYKLLTRDSRMRERRKPGQAGRARHKKQSPKR